MCPEPISGSSGPGQEPPSQLLGTSFALRANDRWQSCGLPGCVIMASGLGKRFGGNKLMAELGGKPLVAWALDATEGIFQRRVVVTRHNEVAELCRRRQVPVVLHDLPYRSDTVRLGLEALGDGLSGCMFCPGDQPLLSRESVRAMALRAAKEQEYIWRLSYGGDAGTPVLFPRWAFPQLRALPQGKGGSVILKKNPGQVRLVPAPRECELWDVDSPEDLERVSGCLGR